MIKNSLPPIEEHVNKNVQSDNEELDYTETNFWKWIEGTHK